MKSFCVLGPGRVGRAIAARLAERGRDVELGRDPGLARGHDVVFLAVPDREIAPVAARLEDGPWTVHCAGALGLDALGPGRRRALAIHPLMTFGTGGEPSQLDGAQAAVSARDAEGLSAGIALARLLGLAPFVLDDAARPLYHAAAVLASNAVSTLVAGAVRTAAAAGVDDPAAALAPLLRRALENALADPARFGLTGPIARGDAATVAANLEALAAREPEVEALYRALAAGTIALIAPERSGMLQEVLAPC